LKEVIWFTIAYGLFALQQAIYYAMVERWIRYATLCCGRRSGKTVVIARIAAAVAMLHPKEGISPSLVAICYPTLDRAILIAWPFLLQLAYQYDWRVDVTRHHIILPDGAEIWLIGLDSTDDTNKLRGNPYWLIIIDECQNLKPDFRQLMDYVINPALEDHNGSLLLAGTCDPLCHGFWYDACHDDTWSHFNWSMFENPLLPAWAGKTNWKELAEQARKRILEFNHWTEDDPVYRNEYLGLWTKDESKLVYNRYNPAVNDYDKLPEGQDWRYTLSLDFGFVDSFAINCLGFSYTIKPVYELDTEGYKGTTLMEWAAIINRYRTKYKRIVSMVGDEGGLGKAIVVELNKRYGFNIKPAEKTSKWTFIQLVNSLFSQQLLYIRRESPLKDQLLTLMKARGKEGKEDPKLPNDLCDSLLYNTRESRHWLARYPVIPPEPGSPEYFEAERNKMFEIVKKKRQLKNRENDFGREWSSGYGS
jgi:hypothetical protein